MALEDIVREPYRYMLINREQWEEFGAGERVLYDEEWVRLQKGQKLVGACKLYGVCVCACVCVCVCVCV